MAEMPPISEKLYISKQHPVIKPEGDHISSVLPSQAGLYVLSIDESASIAYNMSRAYLLEGFLDIDRIKLTIQRLIDRHDALKCSFFEKDGRIWQKFLPTTKAAVSIIHVPKEYDPTSIHDLIRRENNKLFDLNNPPLIRCVIFQFDDEKSVMVITGHHIIGDKLSFDIFIKEFNIIYNDINESIGLLPAPSFTEYVKSRESIDNGQKEYWEKKLLNCPPLLELPYDWSRPAKRNFKGDIFQFTLSKETATLVNKICSEHHVTPYIVFCSAFLYLLNRISKLNDVMVGTPVSNRLGHQQNNLFGFITDMMPIRVDISNAKNFLEIIKLVRKELLQGLSLQPICFHSIMNAAKTSHHSNYNPLLQVYFLCENEGREKPTLDGNVSQEILVRPQTSKCDLILNVIREDNEFRCEFEYDSDIFSYDSISWYSKFYRNILSQVTNNVAISLEDINQIIAPIIDVKTNDLPIHETMPLHHVFEEVAEKYPDKIALTFGTQTITYKELNTKAGKIAKNLQGEGQLIGIYMEPSIELVAGILGILKAGAAYVPLDIKTPTERIKQIVKNAGILCVVINQDPIPDFVKQIPIDLLLKGKEVYSKSCKPHDLAYVIHTSGTTGQPKGVMITHHNVHRLFLTTASSFNFNPNDCWLLFHSYAFDFSVWEMWGALLYGGHLIIPSFIETRDPDKLFNLISNVTILNQTPSAFYTLLNYMKENDLTPPKFLRAVVFGGEDLDFNKLNDWFDLYKDSNVKMINMYGITETTVHVTYKEIKPSNQKLSRYSNIGKPIPDLSIAILDEHQKPVLPYVFGEIYVAGDGVGAGYLNQEELSKKKFIKINGKLYYRSGDGARLIEGGEIEYLGRLDNQVQLRGFRVELSEIQGCIDKYPSIKNSFICVRRINEADYLYAYYMNNEDQDISESLRQYVRSQLPSYMVPHHFVRIEKIPLTINGKLDLSNLPLNVETSFTSTDEGNLYKNEIISQILEELLLVKRPDLNQNFFSLGGDSLLGIRFISKIKTLNIFIELSDLYQNSIADILKKFAPISDKQLYEHANEKAYKPFSLIGDTKIIDPEVCDSYPLTPIQQAILKEYRSNRQFVEHCLISYRINLKYIFGVWDYIIQKLSHEHPAIRSRISSQDDVMEVIRRAGVLCVVLPYPTNGLGRWYNIETKSKFLINNAPLVRFYIHECDEHSFIATMSYSDIILDKISAHYILESCINQYAVMIGQISEPNERPQISKISQPLQFIGSQKNIVKNSSIYAHKCIRETVVIDDYLKTAILRKACDDGIKEENIFSECFLALIKNEFPQMPLSCCVISTQQKTVTMIGQLSQVSHINMEEGPSPFGIRICKRDTNNFGSQIFSQKLYENDPPIFDLELVLDQIDSLSFEISIVNSLNKKGLNEMYLNILKDRSKIT